MKTYIVDYVVGNTYKVKRVRANSVEQACKKSKTKQVNCGYSDWRIYSGCNNDWA